MRKYISIIISLILIFSLTSCFWKNTENDDIEDIKNAILSWETEVGGKEDLSWDESNIKTDSEDNIPKYVDDYNSSDIEKNEEKVVNNNSQELQASYSTEYLTSNKFIELNSVDTKKILQREVELTWITIWNVDKIIVNFSNSTSKFPDDKFQLTQFKSWDSSFLYRAFLRFETMDYWTNEYIIEAYNWEEVSKLKVTIYVPSSSSASVSQNTSIGGTFIDLDIDKLPKSSNYWEATKSNWKVVYSNIAWLSLFQTDAWIQISSSDDITKLLALLLPEWYFYWNTSKNTANLFSAYSVSLSQEKYIYRKIYYIPSSWIYGLLELETWSWVTRENISDANTELKDRNKDFNSEIADNLFIELSK